MPFYLLSLIFQRANPFSPKIFCHGFEIFLKNINHTCFKFIFWKNCCCRLHTETGKLDNTRWNLWNINNQFNIPKPNPEFIDQPIKWKSCRETYHEMILVCWRYVKIWKQIKMYWNLKSWGIYLLDRNLAYNV